MESITIHPENKEQLSAIKAMLKAFKIPFEKADEENSYDPEFLQKIKESEQELKEGRGTTIKSKKELDKFLADL